MVMIMAFVTITCVNNRIKKVEDTQDTILKTIRGYDWSGTAEVDSTVDSTATDSSVVADDEFCEDCENENNEEQDDRYMFQADDGKKYEIMVYVCSGRYAKKFHIDLNCNGLQSCKGTIRLIRLREAREMGMTPCRRCIPRT